MNYDAIVSTGRPAWLPKQGATELDILHAHDVPLIGTFGLGEETYLYACLTGAMSTVSIWGYLPLTAEQVEAIADFDCDSTQDLEIFLQEMFVGQRAVVAMARNGLIKRWSAEDVDEEGVLEAAIRFMDNLASVRSQSKAEKRAKLRQAEQARADATRQVLEPA